MVLKFGKRGVNSGNTLKTPCSKFLRSYRSDAYVVREDTNVDGGDVIREMYGIDDMHTSNVPYSLNKKARWMLPNKLISSIKQGEFKFEEYGVQLFEKHNIRNRSGNRIFPKSKEKQADCVSAYFSKGPITMKVKKRKEKRRKKSSGYMCVYSLINRNNNRSSRNKKRRMKKTVINIEQDNLQVPAKREITFDVVYPSPLTSSLTHNPKYIGLDQDKCMQRSKYQKLRRKNQDIIQFDYSNLDNEEEMSEDEEEFLDVENLSNRRRRYTIDLQDFVVQAVSSTRSKRKASNASSNDFVIVPNLKDCEFDGTEEENQVIKVILEHTDTDPKTLDELYGKRYVECECFPRKFIIDISDEVQALDVFTKQWKESFKQVHACVIFVFDIDNEINTTQDGVYKVYLNTSITHDMHNTRIQTIFDFMETNIAECLTRSIFYMETLPDLVQAQNGTFCYRSFNNKRHFERFSDWNNLSYTPDDVFHFDSYMSSCKTNDTELLISKEHGDLELKTNVLFTTFGQICAICFEDIGFSVQGTSLAKCGHWFCDSCWREHLTSKVKSGSINIECPEFACKSAVDKGTILSLLSLNDVIKFTRLCHDTEVDRKDETKWCPNSKCGRVLQVDTVAVNVIRCDCGLDICFKCLQKAHWPATCQSAKHYRAVLREMGLEDNENVDPSVIAIHGMTCPHCKRFFEKIDGCNQMTCLCNKQFCWGCGKDWYRYNHDHCRNNGRLTVHNGTTLKFLYCITYGQNKWIDTALEHRMDQRQNSVKNLRLRSRNLATHLMSYMNKTSNHLNLDFKGSSRGYTKESQKLPEFLEHILDIDSEMHSIAENVGVLLSGTLPSSQRRYFINMNEKLSHNCKAIESCFLVSFHPSDSLKLLKMLKAVRASSLHLIKSMVQHMKMNELLL